MSEPDTTGAIVVLINDLIFETKIRSTAQAVGAEVRFARTAGDVAAVLDQDAVRFLIVDLNHTAGRPLEAVARACARVPGPRVLAFVSHVNQQLAGAAAEAGAHEVIPRSRFAGTLPAILQSATLHQPGA